MQPLALQTALITADAGDSAGASPTPANGASGAVFSDLMTAALPAGTGGGSDATPKDGSADPKLPAVSDGQQSDQVDQDLAALAAASQLASRGVILKAVPTPDQIKDASLVVTPGADKSELTTSELTDSDADADAKPKTADETPTAATVAPTDPAALNVQTLIHMAVTATIAADAPHETQELSETVSETLKDADGSTAPSPLATTEATSLTDVTADLVNPPTPQNGTDAITTPQLNIDVEKLADQTAPAPKIAALQAVAWFDPKTTAPHKTAEAGHVDDAVSADAPDDDTTAHADAPAPVMDPTAQPAPTDTPDPALAAIVISQAAPAIVAASDVQQPQSDILLLQQTRAALPQAGTTPDANATNNTRDGRAFADGMADMTKVPTADVATATSPATVTATAPATVAATAPAPATASSVATSPDVSIDALQTTRAMVKDVETSTSQISEIRGVAQITPVSMPQTADPATAAQSFTTTEWTPNKTSPQDPEARQLEIVRDKASDEVKSNERNEVPVSGGVQIKELTKLGATDIALSFEAQSAPQQAPIDAPQPAPIQDNARTATAAPTATAVATTNVETNGERRTIADDIRLRALERMLVNAARNGTQTLSIQLYPPGLGQVVLRLAMDGQRLRLATRAATTEAADTLRNMEADLRDALAGNGLHLAGFDVSEDGTNDEAPRRQPVEPVVKTRSGGTNESSTVDLNA